ncbi:unnamed protein product [Lactuca saligna]|uniref:Ubiquitin-like protease family profile domain-containing protein n=1 Tax=Lactuca saligna TaxID=75948 RepID=A0AA36A2Z4_LACSI|nr:unnamed protein product [Lactuca saligna]
MQHYFFCLYLFSIGHEKENDLKNLAYVVVNFNWKRHERDYDCGLDLMRHMETFIGQSVYCWDCELDYNPSTLITSLKILRMKSMVNLMLSEHNIQKEMLISEAKLFEKENNLNAA